MDLEQSGGDAAMDLTAYFTFDTMTGVYGLQAKLTYDSTFVRADIKVGRCKSKALKPVLTAHVSNA